MKYTYDLNTQGCLIITANSTEREALRKMVDGREDITLDMEYDALEHLIANSELSWIDPAETGDLTDAPILGLRNENGEPTDARWGYMNYAVRSFVTDLIEDGKAVFTS